MLIDTHAHLNFAAYKQDADEVIRRSLDNDVWMINIGTNLHSSQKAIEIAQKYEKGVYAAVGLHPINLDTGLVKIKRDPAEAEDHQFENAFDYEKYKKLAQSEKVVAIGEIGLDYYWRPKTQRKKALFKEKQKELFLKQLDLAKELSLPIILHCRMAHNDLIELLSSKLQTGRSAPCNCFAIKQASSFKIQGVMHSFVGTREQLKRYLDVGFYIGYNGIIFKQIEGIDFEKLIKATPLEKILIETDCPYLTPPQEGEKRNEPLFVEYIAEKIAEIKGIDFQRVAEVTVQNTKELLNLP